MYKLGPLLMVHWKIYKKKKLSLLSFPPTACGTLDHPNYKLGWLVGLEQYFSGRVGFSTLEQRFETPASHVHPAILLLRPNNIYTYKTLAHLIYSGLYLEPPYLELLFISNKTGTFTVCQDQKWSLLSMSLRMLPCSATQENRCNALFLNLKTCLQRNA